jgi:hypothetical protein
MALKNQVFSPKQPFFADLIQSNPNSGVIFKVKRVTMTIDEAPNLI